MLVEVLRAVAFVKSVLKDADPVFELLDLVLHRVLLLRRFICALCHLGLNLLELVLKVLEVFVLDGKEVSHR